MSVTKEIAIKSLDESLERFLKTFSHVPNEKLDWSPSETAKSAMGIAKHLAGSTDWFLPVLKGEKPPTEDTAFSPETTRDQLVDIIKNDTAKLAEVLKEIPDERLPVEMDLGFMKMTVAAFIMIPAVHLGNHAAQIDYLQTCWGDMEFHF